MKKADKAEFIEKFLQTREEKSTWKLKGDLG